MRFALLALLVACKSHDNSGLAPASDWTSSEPVPPPPTSKPTDKPMAARVVGCIAHNVVRDVAQLDQVSLIANAIDTFLADAPPPDALIALDAFATASVAIPSPDSRGAVLAYVAVGFARLGSLDRAKTLAERAIAAAQPSQPSLPNNRNDALALGATVLAWTGDVAEAITLAKSDPELLAAVATGEARAKDPRADAALQRAVAAVPANAPWYRRIRIVEATVWGGASPERLDEELAAVDPMGRGQLALRAAHAAVEREKATAKSILDLAATSIDHIQPADKPARTQQVTLLTELAELRTTVGDAPGARAARTKAIEVLGADTSLEATALRLQLAQDATLAGDTADAARLANQVGSDSLAHLMTPTVSMSTAARSGDFAKAIAIHNETAGVTSPAEPLIWARMRTAGSGGDLAAKLENAVCY